MTNRGVDDVTELATRHDAEQAPQGDGTSPTYAWAPAEPEPKKRHLGWWIGVPAGIAVIALVASSLVLIAPGTAVAGVAVGGQTVGAATESIQARLADTTIVLTGDGGGAELTGADLGATVDAQGLADAAFSGHPMWNVTAWNAEPLDAAVQLDVAAAASALRAAAPELYSDPVDASVAFDAEAAEYTVTPAIDGAGVDTEALRSALQQAFAAGQTRVEFDPALAPVAPAITTAIAETTVDELNATIAKAGFYVGKERAVPLKAATVASWMTVTPAEAGFDVAVDQAAIQKVVDGLAKRVNRKAVTATVITDTAGAVLRTDVAGVEGRQLLSSDNIAGRYAEQLAAGDGAYKLEVAKTPFKTTAYARRLEVDLSTQTAYLFQNGKVYNSYAISSGKSGTPTDQGHFRIYAKVALQDMGGPSFGYLTENVPWISYYNGDEAFHGAYWHNNFGHPMSHGCVNMPVSIAKFVYDWAPVGTEVWVHA
ncbi:L,D-transpeptidase family protein [Microbacterium terricola]|uniref:L,D-TPase catalytic domain-containing protein n=1 Tax=Microbacterium terricola TaxID=344163 RepID=A0ABM8DWE5_9MICO|nr:L,D-transpeptidase family protein [Microbacterium terricola]UYK39345.1 L,D-transpeptidase/peptidoglycan binding protein [Microbacterium terricola]BDV29932.1 hypothetical protein Microterr_05920 [Microbacterium terricola]